MKKIYAAASILFFFTNHEVVANMCPGGFNAFQNYYFIETGTFEGDSIAKVLQTGLFSEIYSMDIDPIRIQDSSHRFQSYSNVHIMQGDTAKDLKKILQKIDQSATFWLDAHRGSPGSPGEKNTPLLAELDQIKSHSIKTHTILIDDMHCCKTTLFDFLTKEQITQKILEINPDYKISYINGGEHGEYPDNIMVAQVETENIDAYLQERLAQGDSDYATFFAVLKLLSERNVQTIVKTGTNINFDDGKGPLGLFSHWSYDHNISMFSIDSDPLHLGQAQKACADFAKNVFFVLEDPIHYLINFPKQIDFLYLNSAQKQNLNELMAAYDKLTNQSIIMIDNCNAGQKPNENTVIQYLLKRGWYVHTNRRQVILCRSRVHRKI